MNYHFSSTSEKEHRLLHFGNEGEAQESVPPPIDAAKETESQPESGERIEDSEGVNSAVGARVREAEETSDGINQGLSSGAIELVTGPEVEPEAGQMRTALDMRIGRKEAADTDKDEPLDAASDRDTGSSDLESMSEAQREVAQQLSTFIENDQSVKTILESFKNPETGEYTDGLSTLGSVLDSVQQLTGNSLAPNEAEAFKALLRVSSGLNEESSSDLDAAAETVFNSLNENQKAALKTLVSAIDSTVQTVDTAEEFSEASNTALLEKVKAELGSANLKDMPQGEKTLLMGQLMMRNGVSFSEKENGEFEIRSPKSAGEKYMNIILGIIMIAGSYATNIKGKIDLAMGKQPKELAERREKQKQESKKRVEEMLKQSPTDKVKESLTENKNNAEKDMQKEEKVYADLNKEREDIDTTLKEKQQERQKATEEDVATLNKEIADLQQKQQENSKALMESSKNLKDASIRLDQAELDLRTLGSLPKKESEEKELVEEKSISPEDKDGARDGMDDNADKTANEWSTVEVNGKSVQRINIGGTNFYKGENGVFILGENREPMQAAPLGITGEEFVKFIETLNAMPKKGEYVSIPHAARNGVLQWQYTIDANDNFVAKLTKNVRGGKKETQFERFNKDTGEWEKMS